MFIGKVSPPTYYLKNADGKSIESMITLVT